MKCFRGARVFLVGVALGLGATGLLAALQPQALKTNYRVNPLGIDQVPPRLSWQGEAGGRSGAAQSAYRLQAGPDRDALAKGQDSLWDSGKVASPESAQIAYGGPALESRQRVWWRVKLWDEKGEEGAWSEPAWFETALLNEGDWRQAEWVGCTRDYQAPEAAPAELMGPWIKAASGKPARSYFKDVALPDKQVVSALAWWGTDRTAAAGVVANYDVAPAHVRGAMARAMGRAGKGGFIDLAFYLTPGQTNRIALQFWSVPKEVVAATMGMRIVFADGEERVIQSGKEWSVQEGARSDKAVPVAEADAYGGAVCGTAAVLDQTSLAPAWFRSTVNVAGGLARARLYLCGLGYGIPYLNGARVSDAVFSPPQTDYEAFALYTTHDITGALREGPNALSVLLDPGWYHEVGGFGTVFSYGRPGLKALVALDYADGKTEWVASGSGWQWKEGAIRKSSVYRGEEVDYRCDHDEWQRPGAGSGWQAAQKLAPLTPKLKAVEVAPMRATQTFKPVQRWQTGAKTWMFDFGELLHGWVRLNLSEPAGATVRLRFTEAAAPGVMWNVPGSQWWCHGVSQGDQVVADGQPRVFEPLFTTKSFRYVEVSGLSREPQAGDVTAVLVHTDAPALAAFECSEPMLNRLFENGMRTHRNYLNHMFFDIPRERCLWGAESIYSWATAFTCFDWAPNHRLMARVWFTGQMTPDGVPGHIGVGQRSSNHTSSLIWSVSPLFIASKLYEQFGDLQPAEEFYGTMRHFLQYAERNAKGGVIPKDDKLSDHAFPDKVPRNPISGALINALAFFDAERYFARMAEALGKKDDAAHARAQAEKIRAAILTFYDPKRHTFSNGTQDSLALAYGVFEKDPAEQKALAAAMAGYYQANGYKFDGGFMTYELYPMLARHGYVDEAVKMLCNPDYPGPAWSVRKYDATTYWERYTEDHDSQLKRGLNFFAFAHPTGWMISDLAGIQTDPQVPGGRRLRLAPQIPSAEKLDWVTASLNTPYGLARSAWKKTADRTLEWTFTLPANTTAEVCFPVPGGSAQITVAEGKPLAEVKTVRFLRQENGCAVYAFPAGTYACRLPLAPQRAPLVVKAPVPAPARAPAASEWLIGKGLDVVRENGTLALAGKNILMLTTDLSGAPAPARVRFRMRADTGAVGYVRMVGMNGKQKDIKTADFPTAAGDEWKEYAAAVPAVAGKPYSLGLGSTQWNRVEFDWIALEDAAGNAYKRWDF